MSITPSEKKDGNPKNRNSQKANRGKVLTDQRFLELRMQCFNSMHTELGELIDERAFVVKRVIGHRTGTWNVIYIQDTDGLVWELPLTAKDLAVPGRRIQVAMTRKIQIQSVESRFKGATR
jgi:hypothetical protein